MEDNDNIKEFKTAQLKRSNSPMFKYLRELPNCNHRNFTIDGSTDTITCGICNENLNPIWVLKQFATQDSLLNKELYALKEKYEKIKNKLKCKCRHCGKMTPISRY